MLECKKLSVSYGKQRILHEVDFKADNGTVTVVLGKNGSGKTTFLRTLAGVQETYRGSITVDGNELTVLPAKKRAEMISILPQFLPRPAITVEELALCGRYPYRTAFSNPTEEDRKIVEKAMTEAGVADKRARMVCHLSGGERQLAYTAMLLSQNTENVLFDEPTASLDTGYRKKTLELIRTLRAQGKCVVLSIHDLTDAIAVADRILVFDKGKAVFNGTPDDFIASGVPEERFGMHCHRFTEDGRSYRVFIPAEAAE